jgi:hypothetical protein
LLIKSPPVSRKSRALMFIALDKLANQKLKQTIIVAPEKSIGAPYSTTTLTFPASMLGSGTSSPRDCMPSMWNSIASRIVFSTCFRVFPVAMHPGKSGT